MKRSFVWYGHRCEFYFVACTTETALPTDHLTPTVTAAVLFAGVLHAIWNAIAARIEDRLLTFGLLAFSQTAIALVAIAFVGVPGGVAVWFAAGSAAVHIAYNYALLQSYRIGGFGRAYPLARGTSPLLVALAGWFLAAEHLDAHQLAGIATVAAGLLALVFVGGRPEAGDRPAIAAALLTGVTIAAYTVIDGLGVRHASSATGYAALLFALEGPAVAAIAVVGRRRTARRPRAADVRAGLVAGVLSVAAYGIVIWAQTKAPLALVSSLRETSVVSAALISMVVFREPLSRRRVGPAIAVAAGIVVLSL